MSLPTKKFTRRPRRKMARRAYRPRYNKSRQSVHAPKKFVSQFKLLDVNASPYATHSDGYSRNLISLTLNQIPIFANLRTLYGQFAITSVSIQYRPKLNVSTTAYPVAQIMYAANKEDETALSPLQVRSDDNCRVLVSSRGFSAFVKKPRPAMYQMNAAGDPIKVISKSSDVHWLSADVIGSAEPVLPHLLGQMCVSDVTGVEGAIGVGELWCKVYLACKEQRKTLGVGVDISGNPI